MPIFRYQAVDRRGRTRDGVMPAPDGPGLEEKLRTAGLWLIDFTYVGQAGGAAVATAQLKLKRTGMWGKRRRRELIDFCTLMSYQTKVGVTLVKALDVARRDCRHPAFRQVLASIQSDIEAGLQFHESLVKYPSLFSPQFICVVRAGESSGRLAESLEELRDYLEWVDKIIADVRQATLYPIIIACAVAAFVVFLFTFIVPKFAALLAGLHVPLPLITQIVFTASDVICTYWWAWVPLVAVAAVGIPLGLRFSKRFVLLVDGLKLRLPVFGELNRMLALSRFAHNLALLYRAGVVILSALNITEGLVGNAVVAKALAAVQEDIKAGKTISEAMHRQPVFSALLLRMVNVGEQSGNFDQALDNVSEYYNEVIPRRIKALFTVLEPALMLVLIFIVGGVAIAIYSPIIALMGGLQNR
jgi:type II secretory pathway component PulF